MWLPTSSGSWRPSRWRHSVHNLSLQIDLKRVHLTNSLPFCLSKEPFTRELSGKTFSKDPLLCWRPFKRRVWVGFKKALANFSRKTFFVPSRKKEFFPKSLEIFKANKLPEFVLDFYYLNSSFSTNGLHPICKLELETDLDREKGFYSNFVKASRWGCCFRAARPSERAVVAEFELQFELQFHHQL